MKARLPHHAAHRLSLLLAPLVLAVSGPRTDAWSIKLDAVHTQIKLTLGPKLAKWTSLEYAFGATWRPLLADPWRIVKKLVLTVTANAH